MLGLKKFLQDSLGMPVERAQGINHLRLSREVNVKLLQQDLPAFAGALGGGLQALELAPCNVDLVPSEEKIKKEVGRKKKHAFFAAAALLVCILGAWGIVRGKVAQINSSITEAQRDLKTPRSIAKELDSLAGDERTKIEDGISNAERRRQAPQSHP